MFGEKLQSYFETFGELLREKVFVQVPLFVMGTFNCRKNIAKNGLTRNNLKIGCFPGCGSDHSSVMISSSRDTTSWQVPVPKLRILIAAVGTRGDVQPFAALGCRLQAEGHRVRLATHATYRNYVMEKGLEFYPLAGDPMKLSEFMVKTHGFVIPTTAEMIREVPRYHAMIVEIVHSMWDACVKVDPDDPLQR